MAKKLADYYRQKGVVLRVLDRYRGEVEMADSGDVLQVGGGESRWSVGGLPGPQTPPPWCTAPAPAAAPTSWQL